MSRNRIILILDVAHELAGKTRSRNPTDVPERSVRSFAPGSRTSTRPNGIGRSKRIYKPANLTPGRIRRLRITPPACRPSFDSSGVATWSELPTDRPSCDPRNYITFSREDPMRTAILLGAALLAPLAAWAHRAISSHSMASLVFGRPHRPPKCPVCRTCLPRRKFHRSSLPR